jgi:hypothetical protein
VPAWGGASIEVADDRGRTGRGARRPLRGVLLSTDPQVKALLEKARPAVAQHLADAQKLQGSIR